MVAISLAVVKCPLASSPVQFLKVVFVIPRLAAFSFIRATNPSSLPEMCSPKAQVASLAEPIADALKSSSTVIVSPTSSHICDPPIEEACSEHVTDES